MKLKSDISVFFILLSIVLWTASLFCPVFVNTEDRVMITGWDILFFGSLVGIDRGWTENVGYFAVYANCFWMMAILLHLIRKQVMTGIKTTVGILIVMWGLAVLTFSLEQTRGLAGELTTIETYGSGLYLWFAAFFSTTVGILLGRWLKPSESRHSATHSSEKVV